MINWKAVAVFVLAVGFQVAFAQELPRSSESALEWLKKMTSAPSSHNYVGTFVYYADNHVETSRITHKVDQSGEHEKIEVLDGIQRIVFRDNDEMKCFLPESKKIYTEKRWFRKFFPNLIPQSIESIDENYYVQELKQERVTDRLSQVLLLSPRDALRYAHQFWIDTDTGLLLRVTVLNGKEIVEQFAFVQLDTGISIDPDLLKPERTFTTDDWKVTHLVTSVPKQSELKWRIANLPPGFKKITEMKRNLAEKSTLVDHIALTDSLATVSIFIEPIGDEKPTPTPGFFSSRGAINIYVRVLEGNKITTVGEVPLETTKLIGDAVAKY